MVHGISGEKFGGPTTQSEDDKAETVFSFVGLSMLSALSFSELPPLVTAIDFACPARKYMNGIFRVKHVCQPKWGSLRHFQCDSRHEYVISWKGAHTRLMAHPFIWKYLCQRKLWYIAHSAKWIRYLVCDIGSRIPDIGSCVRNTGSSARYISSHVMSARGMCQRAYRSFFTKNF